MTGIVERKYKTKKSFKQAVKDHPEEVYIDDPSIFANNRTGFLTQILQPGQSIAVTNHPKRSWYANIVRKDDGSFKVE